MFERPFSFDGRIRRTEYCLSLIIYVFVAALFQIPINNSYNPDPGLAILFLFLMIPLYWLMLAQGAKRCHDLGNSGWFQLIPFYGLWLMFAPGDVGPNSYGSDPKGNTKSQTPYNPYVTTLPTRPGAPTVINDPSIYNQPAPTQITSNNSTGGYQGGNYDGGHNNHGMNNQSSNIPNSGNSYSNVNNNNRGSSEYQNGNLYN